MERTSSVGVSFARSMASWPPRSSSPPSSLPSPSSTLPSTFFSGAIPAFSCSLSSCPSSVSRSLVSFSSFSRFRVLFLRCYFLPYMEILDFIFILFYFSVGMRVFGYGKSNLAAIEIRTCVSRNQMVMFERRGSRFWFLSVINICCQICVDFYVCNWESDRIKILKIHKPAARIVFITIRFPRY